MSSAMVQIEARRESDAALQTVILDQRSRTGFDGFGYIYQLHPRTDEFSSMLSNLSMHLSRLADGFVGLLRVFVLHLLRKPFLL